MLAIWVRGEFTNATKLFTGIILLCALASAKPLLLIFDASGSMEESLPSGVSKIDAAKSAANEVIDSYGDQMALMVYTDCDSGGDPLSGDISVWVPFTTDKSELKSNVNSLTPEYSTPIADSILEGISYMDSTSQGSGTIVVLTDGEETCGSEADVENAISSALGSGYDVRVVGYALDAQANGALEQTVLSGGGKFYTAGDEEELRSALRQATGSDDMACCTGAILLMLPLLAAVYSRMN